MNPASSCLQRFNTVDVNQRDMNKPVGVGIDDGNPVLADGDNFRVPDLMGLAVRKPQLERLERAPIQPLPDGFRVHEFGLSE